VGKPPPTPSIPVGLSALKPWLKATCLGLSSLVITLLAGPSLAAERLIISYGILERSIAIEDLEYFAETGDLTPQLAAYNNRIRLEPDRLEQIRGWLTTPADLDSIAVAQFLYTEQGKLLLKQLTQVIQTPSRQAGFPALRSALILAAADETAEFTLLNVLRQYPTAAIRVDLGQGLAIAQSLNQAILQAELAVDLVQNRSQAEAEANPGMDFNPLLQLLQDERQYGVRRVNLVVPGLPQSAELYLPRVFPGSAGTPVEGFPLVIISHGLGSTRNSFAYLAGYLATGGITVVTIEHSGSNDQQLFALLEGRSDAVVSDEEFLRRPLEVSLTLDALDRAQAIDPALRGQINLEQVGVVGQSFGGYTGLTLAGADLDLENLGQECPPGLVSINPSILLQCQATRLGNPEGSLRDPRIKSLLVINPIGSILLGEQGYGQVDLPVMVISGTADTIAPAFPEQIQPFTWLGSSDRYLVLVDRGTHFSAIGDVAENEQPLTIPPELVGPRPELVQAYIQILGLAFFKLTLEQDNRFDPLVQASFAEALSAEPHPLSLTTTLSAEDLQNALEESDLSSRQPQPLAQPLGR
jgi:predicted dienelactone hydrolase